MAKDPALLWYFGDWHSGTSLMTRFQKGCYMDVLHAQFNHGRLSLEDIKTCLGSDFGQVWPALQKKFKKDDNGLFFNERLEQEKIKRVAYVASRSNGKAGRKVKNKSYDKSHDFHTNNHTENANVDEDLNELSKKIESLEKVMDAIFSDEIFIEKLRGAHRDKDLKQAFKECYIHHSNAPNPPEQLWQWRQKLNTWLTIKPKEKKDKQPTNIIEERKRKVQGK